MTSTGLILVVYNNYNLLQSFCFEKNWLGDETYISKNWYFNFRVFSSKLIFRLQLREAGEVENVPVYSCEGLGFYTYFLGWLYLVIRFKSMLYFMWFYTK